MRGDLADPDVAKQAHTAGVGKRIQVQLGGKSHPLQGAPVPLDVEIVALSNGKFTYDGPMFQTPVAIVSGEIVERDGFVFADILPI